MCFCARNSSAVFMEKVAGVQSSGTRLKLRAGRPRSRILSSGQSEVGYLLLRLRELSIFEPFFGATFLPLRRASDRPIAIACFRLFTVFPLRPLLSVPRLTLVHRSLHILGSALRSLACHDPSRSKLTVCAQREMSCKGS